MSSLSAPADIDRTKQAESTLLQGVTLTEENVKNAMSELVIDGTRTFPRVEKFYADPTYNNQIYCTHSFVPAKGAVPDKDGVFGMVKCRGTFENQREMNDRAEWIIRNVDSYHSLLHSRTGRPFPLSLNRKYIAETKEVDVEKKIIESTSEDIKEQRDKDAKIVKELKEREQNLLNDVSKPEDPLDKYTTLRVKKAQLTWTYLETMKKVEIMKTSIIKAREDIKEMDTANIDHSKQFMNKYMAARRESGLPDDHESFMKYLVEDANLDF